MSKSPGLSSEKSWRCTLELGQMVCHLSPTESVREASRVCARDTAIHHHGGVLEAASPSIEKGTRHHVPNTAGNADLTRCDHSQGSLGTMNSKPCARYVV